MPYPIALAIGAALSAAGTGMQMAGAAKSRRAMQGAQEAETARQKRYQQQADATFQQSLKKSSKATAAEAIEQGAQRRAGMYDRLATNAAVGNPMQTAGATTVSSSTGAAGRTATATQAAGNAWSKLVGGAQARLGGTDDWGLEQSIKNTRARQDLAITGSNARSSAALLPNEMNIASHQGDGLNAWGQLAGALGSLAGSYAATTPGKP